MFRIAALAGLAMVASAMGRGGYGKHQVAKKGYASHYGHPGPIDSLGLKGGKGKGHQKSKRSSSSASSRGYGGRSHNFGYGKVKRASGYGKHGRKLGGYGPHGVVGPSGPSNGFSIGSRSAGISGRVGGLGGSFSRRVGGRAALASGRVGRFDVGAGRGAAGGFGGRGAAGARGGFGGRGAGGAAAARGPAAGPVRFGRGGTSLRRNGRGRGFGAGFGGGFGFGGGAFGQGAFGAGTGGFFGAGANAPAVRGGPISGNRAGSGFGGAGFGGGNAGLSGPFSHRRTAVTYQVQEPQPSLGVNGPQGNFQLRQGALNTRTSGSRLAFAGPALSNRFNQAQFNQQGPDLAFEAPQISAGAGQVRIAAPENRYQAPTHDLAFKDPRYNIQAPQPKASLQQAHCNINIAAPTGAGDVNAPATAIKQEEPADYVRTYRW